MSTTTGKAGERPPNGSVPGAATTSVGDTTEVLTLSEAAAYLRVAEEDVARLAALKELPGRQIGSEWRFLKAGLPDWLRTPARISGRDAMLALAGAWKDDPDIDRIVQEAHRRRGRRVTEPDE